MKTCYVSIPFGRRPALQGRTLNFDSLYFNSIKPAVSEHGFLCLRADELQGSANIHESQLAAIINSDAMIADITTHNPNVLYELGIRHVINPGLTIPIIHEHEHIPFDLQPYYSLSYDIEGEEPTSEESLDLRNKIGAILAADGAEQDRYQSPLHDLFPKLRVERPRKPCVFIGHGHSKLWARLQLFFKDDLGLDTVTYESEARAGMSIEEILEGMLRQATFATFVLTGEDETAEGSKRARQNVVHEAGLFQGVLGFPRAILLVQKGLEEFSNVAGLQYIEFETDKIESTFYELQRALKREELIK